MAGVASSSTPSRWLLSDHSNRRRARLHRREGINLAIATITFVDRVRQSVDFEQEETRERGGGMMLFSVFHFEHLGGGGMIFLAEGTDSISTRSLSLSLSLS